MYATDKCHVTIVLEIKKRYKIYDSSRGNSLNETTPGMKHSIFVIVITFKRLIVYTSILTKNVYIVKVHLKVLILWYLMCVSNCCLIAVKT
jgi:hypothetical protein